jgi:hypothetical protein
VEQVPVFGHKEEDQPVDKPEQLPVEVLLLQLAGLQAIAKSLVRLMGNESCAEILKRLLNADTQLIECAPSICLRLLGPLFEPAGFRAILGSAFKPRLVANHPQQAEVRVGFTFKDSFEVEFDVGLAREAGVVAQDEELEAVRNKGPKIVFGAVEELLHHSVRTRLAGALDALLAALVEIGAEAHKMDGHLVILTLPYVRNGVGLFVDLEGAGAEQAAVPQLLKELKQPPLASQRGAEVRCRQSRLGLAEAGPQGEEASPGAADGFVEFLAGTEVVVLRFEAGQVRSLHEPAEKVGGEQSALGADIEEGLAMAHVRPPSLASEAAHRFPRCLVGAAPQREGCPSPWRRCERGGGR